MAHGGVTGKRVVMAIGCHPGDIEFSMAGTLMLLGEAGCELHYMNVANGCYGSATMTKEQTRLTRLQEAREAADLMGAIFHEPLCDDLNVFYTQETIMQLCAIVRTVGPEIVLTHSPQDYMEDHMNASRLAVTATFCRNIPNYPVDPPVAAIDTEVALYHALPGDLADQLRQPIVADMYVDISGMLDRVLEALACHRSQKEWLDATQGMDSYLESRAQRAEAVGRQSGCFTNAEGWRRHAPRGFGPEGWDPLSELLGARVVRRREEGEAKA
jgi:LmbE family N-acetylglucosaminyl deacetylase